MAARWGAPRWRRGGGGRVRGIRGEDSGPVGVQRGHSSAEGGGHPPGGGRDEGVVLDDLLHLHIHEVVERLNVVGAGHQEGGSHTPNPHTASDGDGCGGDCGKKTESFKKMVVCADLHTL